MAMKSEMQFAAAFHMCACSLLPIFNSQQQPTTHFAVGYDHAFYSRLFLRSIYKPSHILFVLLDQNRFSNEIWNFMICGIRIAFLRSFFFFFIFG